MQGDVKVTKYSPDKIVLEVNSDGEAVLVASNTYSKYWKCVINGKYENLFRADNSLWGVKIEKGKSIVEFSYIPPYSLDSIF